MLSLYLLSASHMFDYVSYIFIHIYLGIAFIWCLLFLLFLAVDW